MKKDFFLISSEELFQDQKLTASGESMVKKSENIVFLFLFFVPFVVEVFFRVSKIT